RHEGHAPEPNGTVEVIISDTGPGISEEDLNRIFNPYFTTKKLGIGLGLAITKKIVEEHRGRISVRSRPNEGTDVVISLPVERVKLDSEALVILVTAYGTIGSAVQAMKKGAFDYLAKPVDREELLITIARAFERLHLVKENRRLQQQLLDAFKVENIIGHHPSMEEVSRTIKKVAPSQATVLITGESGTGKELVARALHAHSPRAHRPFRALNCAAVPETLIESELFGYEKGAFTGAQARQIGLFEAVDQGTLFLDEIGDLSLPLQAKLLRVLQEKEIRRIGGRDDIKVDVRVVAATNQQLNAAIKQGPFREDLYYRLNVVSIHVPALRERAADIPELVGHFLKEYAAASGKAVRGVTNEASRLLMDYPW